MNTSERVGLLVLASHKRSLGKKLDLKETNALKVYDNMSESALKTMSDILGSTDKTDKFLYSFTRLVGELRGGHVPLDDLIKLAEAMVENIKGIREASEYLK